MQRVRGEASCASSLHIPWHLVSRTIHFWTAEGRETAGVGGGGRMNCEFLVRMERAWEIQLAAETHLWTSWNILFPVKLLKNVFLISPHLIRIMCHVSENINSILASVHLKLKINGINNNYPRAHMFHIYVVYEIWLILWWHIIGI